MERPLALVVDEDPTIRNVVRDAFVKRNLTPLVAGTGEETAAILDERAVDLLVVDLETKGISSLDLLRFASRFPPAPVVIAIAASANPRRVSELIASGAFDVLREPTDAEQVQCVVQRALRQHEVLEDVRRMRRELLAREDSLGLVGRSAEIERLRDELQRLAGTAGPICFLGEPGTGKELAARTLQRLALGEEAPFLPVSCASLAGASWGTRGSDALPGLLERARGGAVYFDELPGLALDLQERLLEALSRPGGLPDDVRLLSSATGDPHAAVEQGRLLDELQRRLMEETLRLPPLRERREDIGPLARHFVATICEINDLPPIRLSAEALAVLERHSWPSNVQELRNAMEQAAILASDGSILPRHLPEGLRKGDAAERAPAASGAATARFREAKRAVVEQFERAYLRELMDRHGGNVTAASQRAGMLRSALQRLLRKYGLKSADFRRARRTAPAAGASSRPGAD